VCVYIYWHVCMPILHLYVFMFTCMYAEFTHVCVYIHVCAHGNYMCAGICLHRGTQNLQVSVCAQSLHVYVHIFTCA